jgi:hypothetical protein
MSGWRAPQIAADFREPIRGGSLSSQIARAVGRALKGRDREAIAQRMSGFLGERISKSILDAYASEARSQHRISAERFIALIAATECFELIGFIAGMFDHAVVPNKYAAIIELHQIEQHERELANRKAELMAIARQRP